MKASSSQLSIVSIIVYKLLSGKKQSVVHLRHCTTITLRNNKIKIKQNHKFSSRDVLNAQPKESARPTE